MLTFEDQEPQDRSAPWDWVAITRAGAGCAAVFFGASELQTHALGSAIVLVPLLAGLAPIVLHIAMTAGSSPSAGIGPATWVCFGIAAGGGLFAIVLFILGRARLQRPDLEPWDSGESPAWYSPPLLAGVRGERRAPSAAGARG